LEKEHGEIMDHFKIFIVEDNVWYGELLKHHLSLNPDYEVHLFATAKECLDNLHLNPHVISVDLILPDLKGEELLKRIKSYNPDIPIIIISGQEDISIALQLLKKGAYDYLLKDENTKDLLWNDIIKIKENHLLKKQVETLKEQLESKFDLSKTIIGQSNAIKKSFSLIEKAIKTNINVSISGETGTGKELVAKAIHFNSRRNKKPFIAVNMAAIPKELIESELFGHEQGAFTNAISRKKGKFEEANGGTIFLDEIAELDLSLQSKLLRVIQEREITRIGGNDVIKFDVRLLIATHKNLPEEIKKGNFREDLYYRIIGLPIDLPPLRDRGTDILMLAKYFADLFTSENKISRISISEKAKEKLMKYSFPGNIRELKALIDLACVMCDGKEITEHDFSFTLIKEDPFFGKSNQSLREYTADIIKFYLQKNNNNVLEVASILDIGKSTIYNLIKSGEIKL
jgi:DNA-binding NtrC family response regulator